MCFNNFPPLDRSVYVLTIFHLLTGLFDDATLQSPEVLEQVMEFISSGSTTPGSDSVSEEAEPEHDTPDNFDVSFVKLESPST